MLENLHKNYSNKTDILYCQHQPHFPALTNSSPALSYWIFKSSSLLFKRWHSCQSSCIMLLVCAGKPFVKLQPPRLQEHLPNVFRWNAIVFRKTSSSLRRKKHLRTRRLRAAQSAGSAGAFSSLPRHCACDAHLVPWRSLESRTDATLEASQLLRRAAVWWGLAVVTLRTERASLNFHHILPPFSLHSTDPSVLQQTVF